MKLHLSTELTTVYRTAREVFGGTGVDPASDGEIGLVERADLLRRLDGFTGHPLPALTSSDALLAAAMVARAAGAESVPVPVTARLMAGALGATDVDLLWTGGVRDWAFADHVDLCDRVTMIERDGQLSTFEPDAPISAEIDPYTWRVTRRPGAGLGPTDPGGWSMALLLEAFRTLGALERALELSIEHVRSREQFGRKLSYFQGVRNTISMMAVDIAGLRELCLFSSWRWRRSPAHRTTDALLLRVAQLRASEKVTRQAHQLHGAMGYCLEYPIARLTLREQVLRTGALTSTDCMEILVEDLAAVEMHYDGEIAPAWPVHRGDRIRHAAQVQELGA